MEVERIIFPFGEKRERRRARPGFMFSIKEERNLCLRSILDA
jgi:hypothetical protein